MIVVVIIGLLAAMAIPAFQTVRRHSQASSLANDFRVYANAFQTYVFENGAWPADNLPGQIPPEMTGWLSGFDQPSALNGQWDWEYSASSVTAGISHRLNNADPKVLRRVDTILDDGDLTTGRVRSFSGEQFTYILVP